MIFLLKSMFSIETKSYDDFHTLKNISTGSECMMCICECDMVLACGHAICMVCAYKWYIESSHPLKCQLCDQSVNKNICYCICD